MNTSALDLTLLPHTDPLSLYRYRDGLYAVDLLTAATVHEDFFSWLAGREQGATEEAMQEHFGYASRPLDVMLTLFRALGYVKTVGGISHGTALAKEHLVRGGDWDLGPYFASLHSRPVARDFVEVLRSGKPAGWSGDAAAMDWHKAMEEEAFARNFTAAMDCRGRLLAAALTAAFAEAPGRQLLDIGGGSGIYACSFAARFPEIRATVVDQSPVDRICAKLIAERGYGDRVDVHAANMFDGLPAGYDVHLFSNVLHDWDFAEVRLLLARSRQSLAPGGKIIIHDAFINADKTGPLHVAEYSALLMHSTQGKCYSVAEYAELLTEAGFQPGDYRETAIARGFMVGTAV